MSNSMVNSHCDLIIELLAILEQISAEGTGGIVGGGKPFVETGGVELLLTGPAGQLG